MGLDDLEVYQRALDLGERVWKLVAGWRCIERDTVGHQVVRSADSVAANISEGFGRYHFKENRRFCYYARGSLSETRPWLPKAYRRGLMSRRTYGEQIADIDTLSVKLNNYIESIGR